MLREFLTQFRFFLRGRQPDRLDDELAFHIQQATERGIAEGLDASEARRQAVLEFGGLDRTREDAFRQHPGWFLSVLLQDLRYALRGFRRRPLFPVVIVLTMTLGIGATTAVFSIVDRILFRSLPYDRAEQLVSIGLSHDLEKNEFVMGTFYYEWRDKQTPFTAVTSQGIMTHACDLTESEPVRLACIPIERNFLPTFGINPVLGRNFLPEESRPGGPSVALISYALWQTRYHHDPSVLNKLVVLDSTPLRIIGVLPESFELPTLQAVDILTPYAVDEVTGPGRPSGHAAPCVRPA